MRNQKGKLNPFYGRKHSKESIKRMSEAKIGNQYHSGKHASEETIRKLRKSHQGKHPSEETKRKMRIAAKRRVAKEEYQNGMKGKHHSEEAIAKMRKSHKGHPTSKATKRKIGKAHKGKDVSNKTKKRLSKAQQRNWENPEYREKQLKAIFVKLELRPTKPEKKLRRGLNKLFPGEYKYIGNGSVLIGYKNPDFINVDGQKKIIEMFGNYWHSKERIGRTKRHEEQRRIRHFAKYGYKTLIVWECELKDIKRLKKKLIKFHREEGKDNE